METPGARISGPIPTITGKSLHSPGKILPFCPGYLLNVNCPLGYSPTIQFSLPLKFFLLNLNL